MSDKVKVVWTLTPGCVFRAPVVSLAHDDVHHETPQDLDLRYGLNEGIERATVDYWERNTGGLRFERVKDTVVITAEDGRDPREQLNAERRALDRERLNADRRALARDRLRARQR
jgi:hypothetical protein